MVFARLRSRSDSSSASTVDPSGMVTATSTTSRQIQLGAKLQFRPPSRHSPQVQPSAPALLPCFPFSRSLSAADEIIGKKASPMQGSRGK